MNAVKVWSHLLMFCKFFSQQFWVCHGKLAETACFESDFCVCGASYITDTMITVNIFHMYIFRCSYFTVIFEVLLPFYAFALNVWHVAITNARLRCANFPGALESNINYICVKCVCVLRCIYPRPRTRMWDRSSEGMNTLRNSAEKMPPFFMAPVFLMLRVTERRGCRKWNSLSER